MSNGFLHSPNSDINLDVSQSFPDIGKFAKFKKNLTTCVNVNPDTNVPQIAGNNETTASPLVSNELICSSLVLPDGDNYCIGSYNSTNSKETYSHIWNSNGNHTLYVIRNNGSCRIVYQGPCLNYQLHPENYIPQSRQELFFKCQNNLFTGKLEDVRDLIFVDGTNWQRMVSVNYSIGTNGFTEDKNGPTNKFKFSDPADPNSVYFDPCLYIELMPRNPFACIGIKELENVEWQKNNFLLNKLWQFRIRAWDVFGRQTEPGVISALYVPNTNSCQSNVVGLARCLELEIEAGNPTWNKIEIWFRNCVNTNSDIPATTDWFKYDTVDKYGSCGVNDGEDWFNRIITLPDYNKTTNTWKYTFCGDKECSPIPIEISKRTENPVPIVSSALTRLGNGIALANNLVDYPPIPCEFVDALSVEYEPPVVTCKEEFTDIEFWAVIHNPFINVNEFISNVGGTPVPVYGGFTGGTWEWGGIGEIFLDVVPEVSGIASDYGQTFDGQTNNQRNFWAYLEGTDFKVQGFQQLHQGGNLLEWGAEDLTTNKHKRAIARRIKNGDYYLQHFVFRNVPKGKYLIRIAGHNNSMDVNYQDSSTYVAGSVNFNDYVSENLDFDAKVTQNVKEIKIDTCDSVAGSMVTIYDMLMILDLTCPDQLALNFINAVSNVYYGYLHDSKGKPVELAPFVINTCVRLPGPSGSSPMKTLWADVDIQTNGAWDTLVNKTDHNGFWFVAFATANLFSTAIKLSYFVEDVTCVSKEFDVDDDTRVFGNADAKEIRLTVSEDPMNGIPNYAECKTINIRGLITDCNNKPVSGMIVCFTRSKSAKTNNLGYFEIFIHNDCDVDLSTLDGRELSTWPNDDQIFISQNGLCAFFACNACVMCVPILYSTDFNEQISGCFDCECDGGDPPICVQKVLLVEKTILRFPFSNNRGIRKGSTIKFGEKWYDAAGRETFVGTDDSLNLFFPSAQQELTQQFGKVKYTFAPKTYPPWVSYVGLYWTDQQAAIEWLEFVISEPVIFNLQTGKISITFHSITVYNLDNNFKTNTTWTFQKGDRIEFIARPDGTFYNANDPKIGILNFQIEGNVDNNQGIIDYDPRLADLAVGTLIQLQRPKTCNVDLFYWEICAPIKLDEDHQIPASQLTGYLDIWNAYLVSRKLRYTQGGVDGIHTYPFLFAHFSPSDFFGGACGNRGRVNTKNPYAQQYCRPMNIMLSDAYSTNLNGLSHFDTANQHDLDDNNNGAIVAMVCKLNYIMFICNKSSFTILWDENTLQVNSQGNVVYNPTKFGRPQPLNKSLGCEMVDISTISTFDGKVMFLDRNNGAMVLNDYISAKDVSEDQFYGMLVSKLDNVTKSNAEPNRTTERIFVAVFDTEKQEYVITNFSLPIYKDGIRQSTPTYINNELDVNLNVAETFAIKLQTGGMRSYYSFTAEYYSIYNDKLISFKEGFAYNHGIHVTQSFNKFYGIQCISVWDFISNGGRADLVKLMQWIELYRMNKDWYAIQVTTESGQVSEIPLSSFELVDNFETSEFLCDKNTFADPGIPNLNTPLGRLYEGDLLSGKWVRVKLISDTANSDAYFEIQSSVLFSFPVQKTGQDPNPK